MLVNHCVVFYDDLLDPEVSTPQDIEVKLKDITTDEGIMTEDLIWIPSNKYTWVKEHRHLNPGTTHWK